MKLAILTHPFQFSNEIFLQFRDLQEVNDRNIGDYNVFDTRVISTLLILELCKDSKFRHEGKKNCDLQFFGIQTLLSISIFSFSTLK